jgi:multisubunit Na+/H+ antiporter MnhF subunit
MTESVVIFCLALMTAAVALALWRLLAGPTVPDRTIAFDLLAICIVAMLALLSILWDTHLFIEIMMIYSLLGFVGTVAFVSYLMSNPIRLLDRARLRRRKKNKP